MSGEKPSFWVVLPGVMTGLAAVITAVGGVLYAVGVFSGGDGGGDSDDSASATATITNPNGGFKSYDAVADTYVDSGQRDRNFGDAPILRVDSTPDPIQRTLLRFEVAGLTRPVYSARLRLACATDAGMGGSVATTFDDWSEAEVDWLHQPLAGDVVSSRDDERIICDQTGSGTSIDYDVTSAITGDGRYDFVITTTSHDGLTFHSRESIPPPQLLIQ